MTKRTFLSNITLFGLDCVNIDRLVQAAEICLRDFEFAEVKLLTSLPSGYRHIIPISPITSVEEYSKFIIAELNSYIDTSHVLVIQYDGFILNPKAWSDEFLKYDYIGAPWMREQFTKDNSEALQDIPGDWIVGNGGFSLRSKKLLTLCSKLARENAFTHYHPEDVTLCVQNRKLLEGRGIRFAPVETAKRFSFEGNEEGIAWTNEFGFHGLAWTDISKWIKDNPRYAITNELDSWALGVQKRLNG